MAVCVTRQRPDHALSIPFLRASLTLPIACWASPFCSCLTPSARILSLPVALPTPCLTLPTASFAMPLTLSPVLLMVCLLRTFQRGKSLHKGGPKAFAQSFIYFPTEHFIAPGRLGFMFAGFA